MWEKGRREQNSTSFVIKRKVLLVSTGNLHIQEIQNVRVKVL